MNCCQDQVVPYSSDLCPKCSLSDWSEWSECNEWSLSTRSRELLPNPGYTRDQCNSALEYNSEIEASALGDVGYEMKEEYGYWVDERSMDADGVPCTGEMGARFLDKIIGVRDPENDQSDVEYRDLLILVDESTSIGAENFEIVKRTLALMVANLCGGVGLHKNRVGLMRFSSAVKPDLHFSEGIALNKGRIQNFFRDFFLKLGPNIFRRIKFFFSFFSLARCKVFSAKYFLVFSLARSKVFSKKYF